MRLYYFSPPADVHDLYIIHDGSAFFRESIMNHTPSRYISYTFDIDSNGVFSCYYGKNSSRINTNTVIIWDIIYYFLYSITLKNKITKSWRYRENQLFLLQLWNMLKVLCYFFVIYFTLGRLIIVKIRHHDENNSPYDSIIFNQKNNNFS